ncbi:hypothetical protein GGF37_006900, partial [Kickxella alabastrina]
MHPTLALLLLLSSAAIATPLLDAQQPLSGTHYLRPALLVQDSGDGLSIDADADADATAPDACPIDTISCKGTDVNPCCSPHNGLLVLSMQWDTRWGPSNAFTVHGLWPDTCTGKQLPANGCDPSRSYSNISGIIQDADPSLFADMTTYWPSNKGNNDWFWTHEWVKHGTCVSTLDPSCYGSGGIDEYTPKRDVLDYFRKILELRETYDLFKALAAAGIVPTEPEAGRLPKNTYTLKEFKKAIFDAWGVEPNVRCIGRRLQEVFLWFKVRGRDNYYPVDPW